MGKCKHYVTPYYYNKGLDSCMAAAPLAAQKLEHNTNVSYMGMMRQFLPRTEAADCLKDTEADSGYNFDVPKIFFADHHQVAAWAESIGMGQYSPLFSFHLINGRRLVTLDALSLKRLGMEDEVSNLKMEQIIRCLSHQARINSSHHEVMPYFFTQSLNLGLPPPQRYQRDLQQFTDPWWNQTYRFIDHSSSAMHIRQKHAIEAPHYYFNSRLGQSDAYC